MLAVAKAVGLQGRAVLVSTRRGDGVLVAEHVFAEVYFDDDWQPADLSEDLSIGQVAPVPDGAILEAFRVDDADAMQGVGFLGAITSAIGGVFSLLGAKEQGKTARRQAEAVRDAETARANAERDALLGLASAQRDATLGVSRDNLSGRRLDALVTSQSIRELRGVSRDVLVLANQTLPALLFLWLVRALVPAAKMVTT